MQCASCGGEAKGKQWWNRDKGYGVCPRCVFRQLMNGTTPEEIYSNYGKEGRNYHLTSCLTRTELNDLYFALIGYRPDEEEGMNYPTHEIAERLTSYLHDRQTIQQ